MFVGRGGFLSHLYDAFWMIKRVAKATKLCDAMIPLDGWRKIYKTNDMNTLIHYQAEPCCAFRVITQVTPPCTTSCLLIKVRLGTQYHLEAEFSINAFMPISKP